MQFGNLEIYVENDWPLLYLSHHLSYHPEKLLKKDLVCPSIIQKKNNKIKIK